MNTKENGGGGRAGGGGGWRWQPVIDISRLLAEREDRERRERKAGKKEPAAVSSD